MKLGRQCKKGRPGWLAWGLIAVKMLVGAFNQEKALVGAFSMIVKTGCGTDGALHSTSIYSMDIWARAR